MLKLKLQYFDHQMRRTDSLEKTLMLGLKVEGEGDDRGWDGWMASLTRWTWVWVSSGSWWWTRKPGVLPFMGSQRVGHDWATEQNWTDGCAESLMLRGLFSGCREWRLHSSCGPQASHCGGFSCETRALGHAGFSSCGSWALKHRLNSCGAQA